MATVCLARFSIGPCRLIFLRFLGHETQLSKQFYCKKVLPIKYTTNEAAKTPIAVTLGIKEKPKDDYSQKIIMGSIFIFLFYFCVFRESNDIDKALEGEVYMKEKELIQLKISLIYCEKNKLPTDALKAKIQELEGDKKIVSPFRK